MNFSLEKVVGGTIEQKNAAKEILKNAFEMQDFEGLSEVEVQKTPEIFECIDLANKVTSEVLERYGINKEHIGADKIHIIKKDAWPDDSSDSGAFFRLSHQCICVEEGQEKIKTAKYIIHEIFHFTSHLVAQILPDNQITDYRTGLTVNTRDGQQLQFNHLNEAVAEELTCEAMRTQLFKETFAEEIKEIENIMTQHSGAEDFEGNPLFTEHTYYAEVGDERQDGTFPIFTSEISYQKERQGLEILIDKLYEVNKDMFENQKEIYEVFVKSSYSGDLFKIGRLIEKTFGKGTFRKLASSKTSEEFLATIENL